MHALLRQSGGPLNPHPPPCLHSFRSPPTPLTHFPLISLSKLLLSRCHRQLPARPARPPCLRPAPHGPTTFPAPFAPVHPMQFASKRDPFLPWSEQMEVAESLGAELHTYEDEGHLNDDEFPDLVKAVRAKAEALLQQG